MNTRLENDITAFNLARNASKCLTTMTIAQKNALGSINEKRRKQEDEWRLNALIHGVGEVGTNAIARFTRKKEQNEFIDREPLLFRLLRRLMRPAPRPEISFQFTIGDLPDGLLVAYNNEQGMCYYPFKCENPRILKDPSWETVQRIFSEAIMDGYSPHYLNVGDRYYTQFKQITKEQFEKELDLEMGRRRREQESPRPRVFDFTGKPVISSFSFSNTSDSVFVLN